MATPDVCIPDKSWARLKSLPDRPEFAPRGYEFLPDAVERDVLPHGQAALEQVWRALAEGDIVALLQSDLGHRELIPQRIWNKFPLQKKVYCRFFDGKMRMGLHDYVGPHLVGWVFVPEGSLAQLLSGMDSASDRSTVVFCVDTEEWYQDYVQNLIAAGTTSSRNDDLRAAREAFVHPIPRERLRELRRRFAPPEWQKGGRRPKKLGRN